MAIDQVEQLTRDVEHVLKTLPTQTKSHTPEREALMASVAKETEELSDRYTWVIPALAIGIAALLAWGGISAYLSD